MHRMGGWVGLGHLRSGDVGEGEPFSVGTHGQLVLWHAANLHFEGLVITTEK